MEVVQNQFSQMLSASEQRDLCFYWSTLHVPSDLSVLDVQFTVDKVLRALKAMPKDNTSHSDSFATDFYRIGGLLLKQKGYGVLHTFSPTAT